MGEVETNIKILTCFATRETLYDSISCGYLLGVLLRLGTGRLHRVLMVSTPCVKYHQLGATATSLTSMTKKGLWSQFSFPKTQKP